MKIRPWLPPALGAALLLTGCGGGPPKPDRPRPAEWHAPVEMLDRYADKDGVVTRAALEAGLRADFAKADANHDGCLDEAEIRAVNQERWREDASTASPLIDFKHNGCVDFSEFAATPRSLFEQMDRNGDGRLTPKELHPGRKPPAAVPADTAPQSAPPHA